MALAPFAVTLSKGVQAVLTNTDRVPEGINEIDPFLSPIFTHGAVKALANTREGLLQQGNQIVVGGGFLLGGQLELAVQGF